MRLRRREREPWDCVQSSEEEDLFAEGLAAVSEPEAGFAFSDDSRSSDDARAAPLAALLERLSVL